LTSKNIASLSIKVRPLALSQNELSSVQELQQAYLSYCKVVLLFLHYKRVAVYSFPTVTTLAQRLSRSAVESDDSVSR
jgi:hypothetical protein